MNKEEEIKKNLHDLDFTKNLNYLVMILVILATITISAFTSNWNLETKSIIITLAVAMAFFLGFLIHTRLNKIKDELKNM